MLIGEKKKVAELETIKHIDLLLKQHDKVIIPGLGAFITDYGSAKVHPVQNSMSAPHKAVIFDSNQIENDGILINHMAVTDDISVDRAKQKIDRFAQFCVKSIEQGEAVIFPGIGKLMKDHEGAIVFQQDTASNHLLHSFGLPEVKTQAIVRAPQSVDAIGEAPVKRKRKRKWFVMAIPAIILIIAIGFLAFLLVDSLIRNQNIGTMVPNSDEPYPVEEVPNESLIVATDSAVQTPETIALSDSQTPGELLTKIENDASSAEEPNKPSTEKPKEEPVVPEKKSNVRVNSNPPKGYFIIVGSYVTQAGADEMIQKLNNRYEDIYRIDDSGKFRVGLFSGLKEEIAIRYKERIQIEFKKDAWVLNR